MLLRRPAFVAVWWFLILCGLALLGARADDPLLIFAVVVAFSWTALAGLLWLNRRGRGG